MSNTPENQLNTSATDSTTAKKSSGLGFKLALTHWFYSPEPAQQAIWLTSAAWPIRIYRKFYKRKRRKQSPLRLYHRPNQPRQPHLQHPARAMNPRQPQPQPVL